MSIDATTPEMIDAAEANIREDYRSGRISKEQFQKEMLFISTARYHERETVPKTKQPNDETSRDRVRSIKKALIGTGIVVYAAMAAFTFGLIWNDTECFASKYGAAYDAAWCRENKAANSMVSAVFWPFALSVQLQSGGDE